MTPQERDLLQSLADRIAATPAPQRDPEADALIREKLGTRPDSLYILTQTVLIQEIALNQANARLHELEQQHAPPPQPTSFLGKLFGAGAAPRPQAPPPQNYAPPYAPQYTPQYDAPPPQYQAGPFQGSSFLRSAASTATGVAAGALAFEGIEALFGHHGGGFGGGYGEGFGGGSFLGGAPSETVINNYYDDDRGGGRGNDGGNQFANADDDNSASADDVSVDNASDDSSYDDSSSGSGDDFSSTDV